LSIVSFTSGSCDRPSNCSASRFPLFSINTEGIHRAGARTVVDCSLRHRRANREHDGVWSLPDGLQRIVEERADEVDALLQNAGGGG
jgi:hypothetical protein